jgi:hypothetical protein
MIRERQQHCDYPFGALRLLSYLGLLFVGLLGSAPAQDIRGLEICTAEKQMDRRIGCLQTNVEFLQQALSKLSRETQDRMATSNRDLAAAQAEIAELKSTVAKLNGLHPVPRTLS